MSAPKVTLLALLVFAGGAAAMQNTDVGGTAPERFTTRVVARELDAPWEIAWGPDGQLWVTERRARRVLRVNPADGSKKVAVTIPEAFQSVGQDGLLGLALHPDLLRSRGNDYVYVSFTYDEAAGVPLLRRTAIRRYTYDERAGTLGNPVDLLTGIPAHNQHNGGRMALGPDGKLYMNVGDQGSNFNLNQCNLNRAQDVPTLAEVQSHDWINYQGKILRVNLDGSIPPDNPVIGGVRSHIYTYGHRNPEGLVFGPDGKLYASEHGPSSDDELNLLEAGRNYGWPRVAGFRDDRGYAYGNWSASTPQPCNSLLSVDINAIPASVPTERESAWSHQDFKEPLKTFFTVAPGYDFRARGNATIAPGGIEIYTARDGVPGWANSLLVASHIMGRVYRVKLNADGRSVNGEAVEYFRSVNRYRDIALSPDERSIYVITDVEGRTVDASGASTLSLQNPGAILEFKYAAPGPRSN